MRKLRQLTPQEVLFVGGETPTVYQHTSGLTLLDASERPDFGFEAFRRHLEERLGSIPQFRWRLHEVPLGLDLPYWVEDETFSFDHHIRRIAVPSPGDRKALGEVVSYLYSRHLDRSRPLWETWFIEGLADGQYGLFAKLHHCMMDGQGANKLGQVICDFEPDAAPREVDPAIAEARPGETPELWRESLNAALNLAGLPFRASREILDALRRELWQRMTHYGRSQERPPVPTATFNCEIGSERGFVFGSVPLEDVKTVKKHFDVTVNDVVLALVGSSLRSYLLGRRELPDDSLRTSIAVSLRTDDDDEFINKVTTATVTLATRLADPVQRLRAIAQESGKAKREARRGAKGLLEIVSILPPVLVNAMMSMAPADQVARMTGINLIVSNVRGSPMPMYIGGARQFAMYPMSIIAPGGGINVTCISYTGNVDFGVTVEPRAFPDPWLLIDGLHEALQEYLRLAGSSRRTPRESRVVAEVNAPSMLRFKGAGSNPMSLLKTQKSWTAEAIAFTRAIHHLHESPVVFEDDVAIDLLSPAARWLCRSEVLYKLLIEPSFAGMRPMFFHSFSCQRYTEDQLTLETSRRRKQYVILGAGLDSFALRRRKQRAALRVFEVDHPESQEIKQRRIARSPHAKPRNLEFVPVNFEVESVLDGLARSSFDFGQPAFCSWLGTVPYLTEDAVFATLDAIAALKPGSELVLNYLAPDESLSAPDREFMSSLEWKLRLGSAPLRCEFAPDTIATRVCELGFDILAHLTSKELDDRYLQGWEGLQTMPSGRLLHLQVAARTSREPRTRRRSRPSRLGR